MAGARVDILLATYNGERYLAEQIDSLLAQTFDDWRVIARDDGSSDGTVRILESYAACHPGKFMLIEDAAVGLGACGNFGRLMEHSTADYVMFCDQDDVWLPRKIETLMVAMRELEAECGPNTPLLVHSDLQVVDSELRVLHPSFGAIQDIDLVQGRKLNQLLIQNTVTGCAALCNRPLVELSLPIERGALMHDWWVALVASGFGRIEFIPEPTVFYRQHVRNTLGAKQMDWHSTLLRFLGYPRRTLSRHRYMIAALLRQARAFLDRYGDRLPERSREVVAQFALLRQRSFLARRSVLARYGFMARGFFPKLLMFIFI